MKSLFVTGTDTGVGKTVVACAIVRGLRARGIDIGAMKPVETGVEAAGPLDAQALRAAADDSDDLDLVCPLRFSLPAAPTVAARAEGRRVDFDRIVETYDTLAGRHAAMLVEGAGGLLVPVDEDHDMAGLAKRLDLLTVVAARASLGTINHTKLTVEALEARGLPCAGVVISHSTGPLSDADRQNLVDLTDWLGPRLLGEIPPLAEGQRASADQIDLDRLTQAMTQTR